MTITTSSTSQQFESAFHARCAELQLPTWRLDATGLILRRPKVLPMLQAWLHSPLLEGMLTSAVRQAVVTRAFGPTELFSGLHALVLADGPPECPDGIDAVLFLPCEKPDAQGLPNSAKPLNPASLCSGEAGLAFPPGSIRTTMRLLEWLHAESQAAALNARTLDEFSDRLTQSYEETNMLFRLAGLLNRMSDAVPLMQMFCDQLHSTLPFRWVALRFNARGTDVPELVDRHFISGSPLCDLAALDKALGVLAQEQPPDCWLRLLDPKISSVAQMVQAEVVMHPIVHDRRVVGIVAAGNKTGPDPDLSSFETQFMDASAHLLSVFHENIARTAEQHAMFLGTLGALTASIDAKDPYTHGHSERVAALASQLAGKLNLGTLVIEQYRITGMVHDVGKIGIPEAVLCKPGRLTDDEFAIIKKHPVIGEQIMRDIPKFAEVIPGVLHHHERWDGQGYPHGLQSSGIPLVARVLALADAFDAMSSNRSYRPAMPRDRVLSEIRRCSGSQFDPDLVEPFLGLDFTEFDELLARSQKISLAAA